MGKKDVGKGCEVLTPEFFLEQKQFNIWDCYSEERSNFNGRLHFHEFYELSVIYEGTSRFIVNGSEFAMGVKSLQLIRPQDYHCQQTGEGEHIRYYNLMFSADFISEDLLKLVEECPGPLCADASNAEWKELLRLIHSIKQAFRLNADDPLTQIYLRTNVENLCIFILQHQQNRNRSRTETMQEPIRRALAFIQHNYRRDIRLSDAAEAAGLSPSYFSSLFHSTMGIPFSIYLTNYRLQIAERYLRSSNLSVKQIAAVCGFSAYPYFVTAFKGEYGTPPGAFRKQITTG
ncbi:MAG: helix-turn-helix transcriptional regulator [Clostridia bacterium]|nr:helix-turn-helix transcriptional regulator [Clostridia bacterium]